MATDPLQPTLNQLESRVAALEKRDPAGVVNQIGKIGIVVGCLGGILGGANTLSGMWTAWTARPEFHTVVGDPLEMRWEPNAQQLSFQFGVAVHNDGGMAGDITGARAYLSRPSAAASPPPLGLGVSLNQNEAPARYPVTVKPKDALAVMLTVGSKLDSGPSGVFGDAGLRKLVVELEGPNKTSVATAFYCFWIGEQAAQALNTSNRIAFSMSDPRCASAR